MFKKLTKKLLKEETGFTLIELLVTIAILGVLFGIVTLTLTGLGSNAASTVNSAELGVVQSAVDIYMANQNTTAITARATAATIGSSDTDADFSVYLRHMPTKCEYSWTAGGVVTQAPAGNCP